MIRRTSLVLSLGAFLGFCTLFTGCQILPEATPDPTRYFVLNEPAPAAPASAASDGAVIGLLPLELPAYLLDARSMAVLDGTNQVTYREFDRWAESLDAGMARVLRGALANQPTIARVITPPFPLQPVRAYDLAVRIIDAAPTAGGNLRFSLSYSLTSPNGVNVHNGTFTAAGLSWDGSPADLAHGLSAAVQQAATAIAAELE